MHEHVNTKITSIFILMEAHESSTGETQAENETQRIPRLYVSQLQYEHVVIVVIHSNADYYPQLLLVMLRPNISLHMHSGGG